MNKERLKKIKNSCKRLRKYINKEQEEWRKAGYVDEDTNAAEKGLITLEESVMQWEYEYFEGGD